MAVVGFEPFSVQFGRDAGTVVLRVSGELDTASAPAMQHALHDVIDEQGSLSVRLDLAPMTFIDSTGLAVLLGGLRRLREKGGDLTLANPSRSTRRVLEIVGLTQVFAITAQGEGGVAAPG